MVRRSAPINAIKAPIRVSPHASSISLLTLRRLFLTSVPSLLNLSSIGRDCASYSDEARAMLVSIRSTAISASIVFAMNSALSLLSISIRSISFKLMASIIGFSITASTSWELLYFEMARGLSAGSAYLEISVAYWLIVSDIVL